MAGHSMEHDHKREEARAAKGGVCVEEGRGEEGGATLRASFPPLPIMRFPILGVTLKR